MSVGRCLLVLIVVGLALTVLPVALLRWLPVPTSAFMLQSPVKPVQHDWVPFDQISPYAGRAVVAAEDQKFWNHQGFDLEAIEAAQEHNKRSKHKRGASTISQQTAKNLFLWPGGGYFRKGIEAGYTLLLETLWPKQRILEVYLNIAEFGPGIYGVEAAAQAFFHKPAAKLTASEAARLAAVLPSPRRWKVTAPGPYVQARGAWILRQMGHGDRAPAYDEPEPEMPESLRRELEAEESGRTVEPESPSGYMPEAGADTPIELQPMAPGEADTAPASETPAPIEHAPATAPPDAAPPSGDQDPANHP